MSGDLHRLAEARSLALHRAVAEELKNEPGRVREALERVLSWSRSGHMASAYAQAWVEISTSPLDEICRAITADTESARALRQTTPFTNVIDPRTRWRIWDEVRQQVEEIGRDFG